MKRTPRLVLALLLLLPKAAGADDVDDATKLFNEGNHLAASGDLDGACAKFKDSLALHRSPGTLYNVAVCLDREGDAAAARADYVEADALASRGTVTYDWRDNAKKRAKELDATLDAGAPPVATTSASASSSATAPDAAASTTAPVPEPPASSAPPASPTRPWQRPVGVGGMAVGGAGIVVGAVVGILAIGSRNALDDDCGGNIKACAGSQSGSAQSASNRFGIEGTISTIGFIGGGVLAAAGAVLFFTAPSGRAEVGISGTGVGARYRF